MEKTNSSGLPQTAVDYIDSVIKAMKYRRTVRVKYKAPGILYGHITHFRSPARA